MAVLRCAVSIASITNRPTLDIRLEGRRPGPLMTWFEQVSRSNCTSSSVSTRSLGGDGGGRSIYGMISLEIRCSLGSTRSFIKRKQARSRCSSPRIVPDAALLEPIIPLARSSINFLACSRSMVLTGMLPKYAFKLFTIAGYRTSLSIRPSIH